MNSEFAALHQKLQTLGSLSEVAGLLGWDEQVNLPEGAAETRGQQMAALSGVLHGLQTDAELGNLLETLTAQIDTLDADQQVVVKEAYKDFKEEQCLTAEFVARRAQAMSKSYHAWAEAHKSGNFATFAPFLQEQIDLAKEYAELSGADGAYDFWIDKHDPGMDAAKVAALFTPLKEELAPIVQHIGASENKADPSIFKGFPTDAQEAFLKTVLAKLGFDFKRGRIDRSIHPFCSGTGSDIRMTTRFFEDNPLDSLFSSIHEAGHGMYEQGLPTQWQGTALADNAGMGVHESQSRLWENQVARSREFWQYFEPAYREAFTGQLADIDSETLYRAVNHVSVIPIRVDSDEVTYNLHIILRFELEKALFSGELAVKDLPAAWNAKAKEILGLELKDNKEGCLQDVHWSGGAFGYFPSYTLGNMMAAQLWYKLREVFSDVDAQIARGEFGEILKWLNENVHTQGKRYNLLELSKKATGIELSHESLIRYLKERYLSLY